MGIFYRLRKIMTSSSDILIALAQALLGKGVSTEIPPISTRVATKEEKPPLEATIKKAKAVKTPETLIAQTERRFALPPGFLERLKHAESSGNPNAKAAKSSARGLFQITKDTAEGVREKHSLPDGDIFDPAYNTLIAGHLASDNAKSLRRAGISPSPTNLHLAHFAGATGARRLLLADPHKLARDVASPGQVKANPTIFTSKNTVSDVINFFANKQNKKG